jgi:hypothetical protein
MPIQDISSEQSKNRWKGFIIGDNPVQPIGQAVPNVLGKGNFAIMHSQKILFIYLIQIITSIINKVIIQESQQITWIMVVVMDD